jgi:RNA polymerase sigma-70 factor (family 1)
MIVQHSVLFINFDILDTEGMNDYKTWTDPQLITALNGGDRQVFEFIYKQYIKDLYRFARKNISSKEECEEIIQEVFTWLWQHHETVKITSLRPYLFQAVKRGVIHYIRREGVHGRYARHYQLFEALYDTYDKYSEEQPGMEREAMQQWIDSSMSQLHDRCQVAFRLRYSENLSNVEIAQRMNINKRTADNYIVTAIAHLRNSYQKLYRAMVIIVMFYL